MLCHIRIRNPPIGSRTKSKGWMKNWIAEKGEEDLGKRNVIRRFSAAQEETFPKRADETGLPTNQDAAAQRKW
jgi:hypothetical protein